MVGFRGRTAGGTLDMAGAGGWAYGREVEEGLGTQASVGCWIEVRRLKKSTDFEFCKAADA